MRGEEELRAVERRSTRPGVQLDHRKVFRQLVESIAVVFRMEREIPWLRCRGRSMLPSGRNRIAGYRRRSRFRESHLGVVTGPLLDPGTPQQRETTVPESRMTPCGSWIILSSGTSRSHPHGARNFAHPDISGLVLPPACPSSQQEQVSTTRFREAAICLAQTQLIRHESGRPASSGIPAPRIHGGQGKHARGPL